MDTPSVSSGRTDASDAHTATIAPPGGNVEMTEAAMGEGFYEAVVRTLAESR